MVSSLKNDVSPLEMTDWMKSIDVIDIHIESFIWHRLRLYDVRRFHSWGNWRFFFGQVDAPRLESAGFSGAVWSIATNPWRSQRKRTAILRQNIAKLKSILAEARLPSGTQIALSRRAEDFRAAQKQGQQAAMLAVQGGNSFSPHDFEEHADLLADLGRITLIHLTSNWIGESASHPRPREAALSRRGLEFCQWLQNHQVQIDLSHASKRCFDAVMKEESLRQKPIIISHGACSAINPSWRNLDDQQIKQIADRGGVIGIIAHSFYLNGNFINGKLDDIVAHLEHMKKIGGEDILAFGSDFDGAIIPSAEFPNCSAMPKLVCRLFERGWTEKSVRKFLGENYLRSCSASRA